MKDLGEALEDLKEMLTDKEKAIPASYKSLRLLGQTEWLFAKLKEALPDDRD